MFLEDQPEKLEEIFKKYKNVSVDVVPGLMFRRFEERPEFYKDFLTKYADRILFGSDLEIPANVGCANLISSIFEGLTTENTINIWGYKSKGLNLPDEVTSKILYENFKDKCHPSPNSIDKIALKQYIEKYSPYFKASTETEEILNFV